MLAFLEEYKGRFVAALITPVVTGLSAAFSIWAAKNLPGAPQVDGATLAAIGSAGALAGAGSLITWLRNSGRQEELDKIAVHEQIAAASVQPPQSGSDRI